MRSHNNCPNIHTGDIAIFGNKNFQEKYQLRAHINIVHKPSSRIETIDNNKTKNSPSSLLPKRVRTLSGVVG